jgi:hypothetical protein
MVRDDFSGEISSSLKDLVRREWDKRSPYNRVFIRDAVWPRLHYCPGISFGNLRQTSDVPL